MMSARLSLAIALLAAAPLHAGSVTFESGSTAVSLVELFTSEGCSSCPPADAWISRWKASPELWRQVVPVVFHVDYWNGLGWPDRFASPANTLRQRRYATAWRSQGVYTPGVVLNGREWTGWSSPAGLPAPSAVRVGRLTVTVSANQVDALFLGEGAAVGSLQIEFALLGGNLESDVRRGENSGRKLRHDFTALYHTTAPLRSDHLRFTATLPLPVKTSDAPVALAAWVTPGEAQPPLQATGGWLPKELASAIHQP